MPTPCTVTGTLQTLTSGKIAQGQVIFQLTNIGTGNPLGVSGTSIFPALTYNVFTAGDGTFTTQLWGNDNITPANTLYSVTFRDSFGNEVGPILYSITGSSANLNTITAASGTTPPVILPSVTGTWTPVATGLTQVGGPATITGTYTVIGNLVYFEIIITPVTNTSSVVLTTHFTLPAALPPKRNTPCIATDGMITNLGTGAASASLPGVYSPAWTTNTNPVYVAGVYELS